MMPAMMAAVVMVSIIAVVAETKSERDYGTRIVNHRRGLNYDRSGLRINDSRLLLRDYRNRA